LWYIPPIVLLHKIGQWLIGHPLTFVLSTMLLGNAVSVFARIWLNPHPTKSIRKKNAAE